MNRQRRQNGYERKVRFTKRRPLVYPIEIDNKGIPASDSLIMPKLHRKFTHPIVVVSDRRKKEAQLECANIINKLPTSFHDKLRTHAYVFNVYGVKSCASVSTKMPRSYDVEWRSEHMPKSMLTHYLLTTCEPKVRPFTRRRLLGTLEQLPYIII